MSFTYKVTALEKYAVTLYLSQKSLASLIVKNGFLIGIMRRVVLFVISTLESIFFVCIP